MEIEPSCTYRPSPHFFKNLKVTHIWSQFDKCGSKDVNILSQHNSSTHLVEQELLCYISFECCGTSLFQFFGKMNVILKYDIVPQCTITYHNV
jgi:hypothetical protein